MTKRRSGKPSPPFPRQHQRRPGAEGEMSPPPQFEAPAYVGADRLRGRVALITGGDSGIGRATAAIVNVGSITGLEGHRQLLDYASTKGAIHAFTKSLAQNLTDKGIRVNAVAPGPVWTPLNVADKSPKDVAKFGKSTPMGRPAQPEEIAPAIVFLASNADSSYITGEVIGLLGGVTTA